ncbi:MAG TPA: dihydrolipoamide acetyltransferase family protein, partial [Acidimicrobiia bacterium]|nr:dihydrolipoamide acetyltransferase family protein [Acidimicrobiia bacterium]
LVAPGDTVVRDQPLVEVQTDKALVELPSPVAGQVVSLAFGPGDIVKVGQTLVVLDDASGAETLPAASTASGAGPSAGATGIGRPKAAPAVRKLALDRGVDLTTVAGTGPGGRIQAADVEAAAAPPPATGVHRPPMARKTNAGMTAGLGWMEPGRHPLRGIRRVTADAMRRSWSEIPHLTTMDEVDATGLLAARRRLADAGIDTTIGGLLVAAVACGLRRYPLLNASLELDRSDGGSGGAIVVHPDCNVGLAVATAEGLVVPVIRNADRRGLADLAAEVRRLTEAARKRRVDLADLQGGTFTISNYGAFGGRFATPLIRPPEVGIMGFGAIRPRPFVVDGEVQARPTLPWSLSADHRLIDGDVATAFAEYVTGLLADPVALLAELLVAGPER